MRFQGHRGASARYAFAMHRFRYCVACSILVGAGAFTTQACDSGSESGKNPAAGGTGGSAAGRAGAGGSSAAGGNAGSGGSAGSSGGSAGSSGGSAGSSGGSAGSNGGSAGSNGGSAGSNGGSAGSSGSGGASGAAGSGGSAGSGGAGGTAGGAGSGGSGGNAAGVRFVGRIDTRQAGATRFAWSGSGILFRFSGTAASVRLDDSGGRFFTVLVDGQQKANLQTSSGARAYPVATGLAAGDHEVRVYRRTEANQGVTSFLGVELNGGTLLAPPPAPDRRIEIIGDSITCGYGNEGTNPCGFTPDTEDHYRSYGAIAARNLQADLHTVAWSGKGIIYNYGDDKNQPLPTLYDRALPGDASSTWDFSRYQPHVVVINLGTNDFSTDGDPDEPTFSNAYRAFLVHVREKYPNAQILCLAPTLLGGDDLTRARTYIETVVNALRTAGDTKIEAHVLQFTSTGAGCDYHPSLATHASMAQALTTKLRSLLGW